MSARLSDHWTIASVTVMPPGWFNVTERGTAVAGQSCLTIAPCPAVLLMEREDDDERETKVVSARFVMDELQPVDESHYATVSADEWEYIRADAERDVAEGRARCKEAMINRLVTAGDEGVTAEALIRGLATHRALALRDVLLAEGLATTFWRENPTVLMSRECVFKIVRG